MLSIQYEYAEIKPFRFKGRQFLAMLDRRDNWNIFDTNLSGYGAFWSIEQFRAWALGRWDNSFNDAAMLDNLILSGYKPQESYTPDESGATAS